MIEKKDINVRRFWEEAPRDSRASRWATLYASLNPEGDIVISRFTHEKLGSPEAYVLLYDRDRHVLGLRPANTKRDLNAYPSHTRGKRGGQRIRAFRACREFGISVKVTQRFHQCQVDNSGILILDLTDTITAQPRKVRTPRRKYDDSSEDFY